MYFEKFSKLDVSMVSARLLSLRAQGTLVMYKVFLFTSSVLYYFKHKIFPVPVQYFNHRLYLTRTVTEFEEKYLSV